MSLLRLVVDAVACYRLTILVTRDTITSPAREWLRARAYPDTLPEGASRIYLWGHPASPRPWMMATRRWVHELVTCAWCSSIWIAAGVVALTATVPLVWQYPAAVLALSGVTGFLADRS